MFAPRRQNTPPAGIGAPLSDRRRAAVRILSSPRGGCSRRNGARGGPRSRPIIPIAATSRPDDQDAPPPPSDDVGRRRLRRARPAIPDPRPGRRTVDVRVGGRFGGENDQARYALREAGAGIQQHAREYEPGALDAVRCCRRRRCARRRWWRCLCSSECRGVFQQQGQRCCRGEVFRWVRIRCGQPHQISVSQCRSAQLHPPHDHAPGR
mmetsp:Transcript_2368/g.6873  ORF Transcript_2368/g.6873 Transcript_2368/m.6873 type:complete len:209 (-) Transcript_2368:1760-2386(-)